MFEEEKPRRSVVIEDPFYTSVCPHCFSRKKRPWLRMPRAINDDSEARALRRRKGYA
jgi:hypothetical protein